MANYGNSGGDFLNNYLDGLKKMLHRQKEITTDWDREIQSLGESDLLSENTQLKEELAANKAALEKTEQDRALLDTENRQLKSALYEQIYNEKMTLLNMSADKLQAYFQNNAGRETDRLTMFEQTAKRRIDEITATLRENRIALEDEIYEKVAALNELLNKKLTLLREEIAAQDRSLRLATEAQFNQLREEPLTEEQMKKVIKKNNLEALIGLNFLNKVGILLLLIGLITASQYTFTRLPDLYKGIFGLCLGAILLVAGEILNRKRPDVFSLGLTSAGIATLFTTIALSYFQLKIITMYPALLLCVLTTIVAFVLALRYNAQTIAAFALIGGYLPLLSISADKVLVYSAMGYLIILNFFALFIFAQRKWTVSSFLGFFLNVAGTIYIVQLLLEDRSYGPPFTLHDLPALCYVVFAFVIYTLIPICSTYNKRMSFKKAEISLLALNTAISALILYALFYAVGLEDYTGLLAMLFAVLYLNLGGFLQQQMPREKSAQALFYLTGLTFVVLIIPFQFGKVWLSLGWLIEGTALLVYGIAREEAAFRKAGAVIFGLCLAAFWFFDVRNILGTGDFFVYKYTAVTLGSLFILGTAYWKRALSSQGITLFKYGTTLNLWLFSLYMIGKELAAHLTVALKDSAWHGDYLVSALMIVVSFLLAYLIPRISLLSDGVMKGISVFINVVCFIALFSLNFLPPHQGFGSADLPPSLFLTGTTALVLINLLAILAMRDLVSRLVLERKLGLEWYPLIISSYFLFNLTQVLIAQYALDFTNAAISVLYVITALAWIVFGFIKRYAFLRRFGLGLAIMAVAKLFLLDLSFLSAVARIASYFAFGLTLLAISFVYQYFSKKLEIKGAILPDEKTPPNVQL